MDINWTQLLDQVQDLRSALETWGVTYEILVCLGISAFALFLISLREIVIWYLRISQLQAQMVQMSRQLSQIQTSVDQVQVQSAAAQQTKGAAPVFQESAPAEEEDDEPQAATARKKFNLDH